MRSPRFNVRTTESQADFESIFRFRYGIYVKEMGRPLPWADHGNERLTDPDDKDAVQFVCESEEGQLVGSGSMHVSPRIPERLHAPLALANLAVIGDVPFAYISKLMVAKSLRSLGVMQALLEAMYRHGRGFGGAFCVCYCGIALVPLYERIGLRKYAEPFFDPHHGMQVPMVNILEDVSHYASKRSFLHAIAAEYPVTSERLTRIRDAFGVGETVGSKPRRETGIQGNCEPVMLEP